MPFQKGNKLGGSRKNVPNKLTRTAKEAFEFAFNSLGGADALGAWAKENQTEFYRLFARLIPQDSNVKATHAFDMDAALNEARAKLARLRGE